MGLTEVTDMVLDVLTAGGETTARPRQETRLDEIDEEITRCFETIVSLRKEARDLRTSQSRA